MVFNGEGCATIFTQNQWREKKIMMKKGKKRKKCSGFEPASLGCEDEHLNHLATSKAL